MRTPATGEGGCKGGGARGCESIEENDPEERNSVDEEREEGGCKATPSFETEEEEVEGSELSEKGTEMVERKAGSIFNIDDEEEVEDRSMVGDSEGAGCKSRMVFGVEDEGINNGGAPARVCPSAMQPPAIRQCLRHMWRWHLRPTRVTAHLE